MPTQIWCLSVTKPKFALSHPISAFFFLLSLVVISFNFRERTIDSSTIPYSLPVFIILPEELEQYRVIAYTAAQSHTHCLYLLYYQKNWNGRIIAYTQNLVQYSSCLPWLSVIVFTWMLPTLSISNCFLISSLWAEYGVRTAIWHGSTSCSSIKTRMICT